MMPDSDRSVSSDETNVTLSEAAQAVMDVIAECHGNLEAVRHRLDGEELDVDVDSSELPSPREQALHVAAQLESCAGALRDAEGS
jgi:hypothetical protein